MKQVLITSSVLIAVILLVRWLFRNRVSQRLIYATWLLVALRLLIPIQFGQSAYSVSTLADRVESQSRPIQQAQEAFQEPVSGPSRQELYEQLLNEYIQQGAEPVTPEIQDQIKVQAALHITGPTVAQAFTAVWIGGMAVMVLLFLAANIRFMRRAKAGAEILPCGAPVPVRLSPNVSSPCLAGVFRPVIYLTPASLESPQSLNHVLAHETTHLRHGDHIWSLVRCVCLCVYWFDPLVWTAAILSKRDCELACDEGALKKLGDSERIPYGKTLLATVSRNSTRIFETATAMSETKKQLKERVSFIVKRPRNLMIAVICLLLVTAITAGCTFTGSKYTTASQALNAVRLDFPSEEPLPFNTPVPDQTLPPETSPTEIEIPETEVTNPPTLETEATEPPPPEIEPSDPIVSDTPTGPTMPSVPEIPTVPVVSPDSGAQVRYLLTDAYSYIGDKVHTRFFFTYDEYGRMTSQGSRTPSDDLTDCTETYTYNEHGHLILHTYDVPKQNLSDRIFYTYSYDEYGRISAYTGIKNNETLLPVYYIQYNEHGQLLKIIMEYENGERFDYVTCTYDHSGALVSSTLNIQNTYICTYEFTYDTAGRVIGMESSGRSGDQYLYPEKITRTYDADGNLIKEINDCHSYSEWNYSYQSGVLSGIDFTLISDTPNPERQYILDDSGRVSVRKLSNGTYREFVYTACAISSGQDEVPYLNAAVEQPYILDYCENLLYHYLPKASLMI